MPESDQQRHIRRGISQWLTAQINVVTGLNTWQGGVRLLVLKALRAMDQRFDQLEALMRDRYHVRANRPMVDFYMKGGNAFKVSIEGQLTSGGDSDWDTQVVFDAWAPMPILEVVSGLIEDIALDELRQAGIAIAQSIGASKPNFAQDIAAAWVTARAAAVHGEDLSNYKLTLDEPQTVRRIFDHDRLGLWFHSSSPLRDKTEQANSKLIPGQVYNDSIKPFILYRMGYTWHAELVPVNERKQAAPDTQIAKPILMELIDVTIPRLNTVEAVEVWDAIATKHITVEKAPVGFTGGLLDGNTVELPFPDIYYHLGEQLNMLCEIADGSSRHQDKILSRFTRLKRIYDSDRVEKARCRRIISEQAGVPSIADLNQAGPIAVDERIYALIAGMPIDPDVFNPNQEGTYTVNPADTAYRLGVLMMMQVVDTTAALQRDFVDGKLTADARRRLIDARDNAVFKMLRSTSAVELAMSDDLVYMDELNRIGYLQLQKVGLCGIGAAALGRVRDEEALRGIIEPLTADWVGQQDNQAEKQYYSTARENGYSFECACVFFTKGKPKVMVTLTTANVQELPFVSPTGGLLGDPAIAPLVEVARQRKMAASMIRDYAVRTALSKQYEAGKESITVV